MSNKQQWNPNMNISKDAWDEIHNTPALIVLIKHLGDIIKQKIKKNR